MRATLLPQFEDDIKRILHLQEDVKYLIFLVENSDPKSETILPPLLQLRDATDHLKRFWAVIYNLPFQEEGLDSEKKIKEYCENSLGAVKRHLMRAACDCYDVLFIIFYQNYYSKVSKYSEKVILKVMPQYFTDLLKKVKEVERLYINARKEKDGCSSDEKLMEQLKTYEQSYRLLNEIQEEFKRSLPVLKIANAKMWFRIVFLAMVLIAIEEITKYLLKSYILIGP